MTRPLPRIAIPEPTSTDASYNQRSLPQYIRAIEAAGGVAVPIPLHESAEVQAVLQASCAGVLLPGSPADMDPARYGEEASQETAAKDVLREMLDDRLLQSAFEEHKPVLGICFGLQSLNVWRHGSLIQHLPAHVEAGKPIVNHAPGREVMDAHTVCLAPHSLLARLVHEETAGVGHEQLTVNSSHHQAVSRPGESLFLAATSAEDGVIEALEGRDHDQFLIAVQWHPERSYQHSAASRALFAGFLGAAREWLASKNPVL